MKRTVIAFVGTAAVALSVGLMVSSATTRAAEPAAAVHDHGHSSHAGGGATTAPALRTPSAIQVEHIHLHHELDAALAAGGKTADAARAVAAVLVPHFAQEEAYAMPPLGLLEALAQRLPIPDDQATRAIEMASRLRAEYDTMVGEHAHLVQALAALSSAAKAENKPQQVAFAEGLTLHARNEEQVLYPTTLLVGEYLELRRAHGGAGRQ